MEYYADTTLLVLIQDAEEKFKDMGWIEKKLTKGFKQLKKEVPSLPVPHFYAQLSALNQSVVVGDSIVGFSIDKYMGADYPLYKTFLLRLPMPQHGARPHCSGLFHLLFIE